MIYSKKQFKDAIKTESDYILRRVKDAIDIVKNEYDMKHEAESNEISKIKALYNLQTNKNKEEIIKTNNSSVKQNIIEDSKSKLSDQKQKASLNKNNEINQISVTTEKLNQNKVEIKSVSNVIQKSQANTADNKSKLISTSVPSGSNNVKVKFDEPKSQSNTKQYSYTQQNMSSNKSQKVGQTAKNNKDGKFPFCLIF